MLIASSLAFCRPWRWECSCLICYCLFGFFAESGIEGLLRDKTRKLGKASIAAEITARVVALTCTAPPHHATHWTDRAMAKAIGISGGSVQRVWRAHKLQPHRMRTFKRSRDPSFSATMGPVASACSLGPAPDSNSWPINFAIWAMAVRGIVLNSSHPSVRD
jgi:hypothetical protein